MHPNCYKEEWYRSLKNTHISPSKLKAFRESREYYKAKYMDGTVEDDTTAPMMLGKMVDAALTAMDVGVIDKDYPVERGKVRQSDQDTAKAIAAQILASKWWAAYRLGFERVVQRPIYMEATQGKVKGIPVCGLPDEVLLRKNRAGFVQEAVIIDWKTANTTAVRSDKAWFYACKDRGYFMQAEVYKHLVAHEYGISLTKVSFRHAVFSTSDVHGKYPVALYELPPALLRHEWQDFISGAQEIMACARWVDDEPMWRVLANPSGYGE